MKKIIIFSAILALLFTACKKEISDFKKQDSISQQQELPSLEHDGLKNPSMDGIAMRNSAATANQVGVIYLDFEGGTVNNSNWSGASFNFAATPYPTSTKPGLTASQRNDIIERVKKFFSPYKVKIVTTSQEWNQAPVNKRQRVKIGPNNHPEIFIGGPGGLSFVGSMFWGDNTPNFVFVDALLWNVKYIARVIAHEVGHTMGFRHFLDENNQLHAGFYEPGGPTNAWFMGLVYYTDLNTWGAAVDELSLWVNTDSLIAAKLGRADDILPNSITANSIPTISSCGTSYPIVLETSSDADVFRVTNPKKQQRITFVSGETGDFRVEIYNDKKALVIPIIDDPAIAGGTAIIPKITNSSYFTIKVLNSSDHANVAVGEGGGWCGITIK